MRRSCGPSVWACSSALYAPCWATGRCTLPLEAACWTAWLALSWRRWISSLPLFNHAPQLVSKAFAHACLMSSCLCPRNMSLICITPMAHDTMVCLSLLLFLPWSSSKLGDLNASSVWSRSALIFPNACHRLRLHLPCSHATQLFSPMYA